MGVAGQHAPPQRHTGAVHPGSGAQRRRRRSQGAAREHIDHGQRFGRLVERCVEQRGRHLHRKSGTHHDQMRHALTQLGRNLQRNQRAPAVADQRGSLHAQRIQQCFNKSCGRFNTGRRFARAAAMAGQIDGQHVPAVVSEVAALQNPDAVVIEHTMDKNHRGLGGVQRLAGGVNVALCAIDVDVHAQAPAFSAVFRARFKSSIRSSASSRPIDSRIVPWLMPAPASASSLMRKCVVLAG